MLRQQEFARSPIIALNLLYMIKLCDPSTMNVLDNFMSLFSISDFQILSVKMHQELQEEEEPAQGQVDQGLPEERRQGVGRRPLVRVREEEERTCQIQQRTLDQNQ